MPGHYLHVPGCPVHWPYTTQWGWKVPSKKGLDCYTGLKLTNHSLLIICQLYAELASSGSHWEIDDKQKCASLMCLEAVICTSKGIGQQGCPCFILHGRRYHEGREGREGKLTSTATLPHSDCNTSDKALQHCLMGIWVSAFKLGSAHSDPRIMWVPSAVKPPMGGTILNFELPTPPGL